MQVAHPQSGLIPDRIEIWKCWFLRRGENRSTRRKTSRSKGENQQQTQPAYGVDTGIGTRATLVGGERSHHCAIPCSQFNLLNFAVGYWVFVGFWEDHARLCFNLKTRKESQIAWMKKTERKEAKQLYLDFLLFCGCIWSKKLEGLS